MSIKIKRHIQAQYPELSSLLDQVKTIPKLQRRDYVLPEAVVRVVTGQMLSSQAAQTIYERISQKAAQQQLVGSWLLDHDSLRSCGLSGSKARTVCEFAAVVGSDVTSIDYWYTLPLDKLISEIKSYRGMGEWTASILALFYIGHEDVFPHGDGSLQKAITLVQQKVKTKGLQPFSPERASPYRSYLALYLWRLLDTGILE